MKKRFLFFLFIPFVCFGQDTILSTAKNYTYKETDERTLKIYCFKPADWEQNKEHPAVVFYFGGALKKRNLNQLGAIANEFSTQGFVSFVVDYRVKNEEEVTAVDCLSDAQDAFTYVRKNAKIFGVNTDQIYAFGYSSGGFLSAALGTLLDQKNGTLSKPNAMIHLAMGDPTKIRTLAWLGTKDFKQISPVEHIDKTTPPTLILVGEADNLFPISTRFHDTMLEYKNSAKFISFPEQGHNYWMQNKNDAYFKEIFKESLAFLSTLTP